MIPDRYRLPSGRDGRTMYDDEPWAHLARLAGFEPFDTESSARSAFRFFGDIGADDTLLVEKVALLIAEANNGGTWAQHYVEEQKDVWRARAGAIIALVRSTDAQHGHRKQPIPTDNDQN